MARVFLRTLVLQANWNQERLQGVGLAWALWPGLRALHGEGAALEAAARRHLTVFNTHPYMASSVTGALLRMEEDLAHAQGGGVVGEGSAGGATSPQIPEMSANLMRSFKLGVGGSYGAIGDGLFWGGLKPFALSVAALGGLFYGPWVGLALFLGVYNLGHLSLRIGGFVAGYRQGARVVLTVRDLQLPRVTRGIRLGTLLLLSLFSGLIALELGWGAAGGMVGFGGGVIAYGSWRYLRAGRSSLSLIFVVSALAVLISLFVTWGQHS